MSLRLFIMAAISISCGLASAQTRPGTAGNRRDVGDDYPWVGQLSRFGQPSCSVWILRHGVAVTARHCFTHQNMDEAEANAEINYFRLRFGTSNKPVIVGGSQIRKIQFDSGSNDIVFFLYDAKATQTIPLKSHVVLDPLPADTKVNLLGYPNAGSKRVISENCRTTGYRGSFPPHEQDSGYEGVFEDTTCAGWFGVSGGVFFGIDTNGDILLYGVVTHTFDILADGSLDPEFIKQDQFGNYSTTMFSPLKDSRDLQDLMKEPLLF